MALLEVNILNNSLKQWLIAILVVVVGTFILNIVTKILCRTFKSLEGKLPGELGRIVCEMFLRTKLSILFVISLYIGSRTLSLPGVFPTFLYYLVVILAGLQVGMWAAFLVTQLVSDYVIRSTDKDEVPSGIAVATLIARVIVWSFIVLLVLDNLGFNITTLVAGLGVGGIAIAMAAQSILADLFASLSILLDKPFKVGDFVIVGDMLGTVENIGLKTTRLTSLSGEQLVFSNADLLSSRIRNYKRMRERRVVFTVGIEYSTTYEKLKKAPSMIKEIVEAVEHTRFDRSHFLSYGDFSLNLETVYYVLLPDFNTYANVQQEINLKIFKKFEDEGLVFAFPSRTLFLANDEKRPLSMRLSKEQITS